MGPGPIVIGTSGWDYPEWVGPFYPEKNVRDKLAYYAKFFPVVEVNSTFYHLPAPAVPDSWLRRTPREFRFAAKFPQTITHQARLVGADEELRRFLAVLRPLRSAGRLAAALLQLPPSLRFDPVIARTFFASLPRDLPVAVEYRDLSWLTEEAYALFREFGLAAVTVDGPHLPIRSEPTAPFAYVRFHGRGSRIWYDYTYSPKELAAWVPRLRAIAEAASPVYVFFNNHFRGDAVQNARQLADQLGLRGPASPPSRLFGPADASSGETAGGAPPEPP